MRFQDLRPQPFTTEIRCDRCGRQARLGDPEFEEMLCIDLKAGYASVFGDGNDVQVDLCQHCLKSVLGPWLRIGQPSRGGDSMAERLRRFDPLRHGGEFPGAEEAKHPTGHRAGSEQIDGMPEVALDLESLAADVFRTPAEASGWLRRPHPLLDDRMPLAVAADPEGKHRFMSAGKASEDFGQELLVERSSSRPVAPPAHSWNYRVIQFPGGPDEARSAIHEVYYREGVPVAYSSEPAILMWTEEDEAGAEERILQRMREAIRKPPLTPGDFQVSDP